jgi:hypothetical protein
LNEKLKQAYERLNLPEDITREELNKRFDMHLKRRRSISTESDIAAYEEVFLAYKFILDAMDHREIQEAEDQRFKKYGVLSGAARKWENFFRLYKTHTIVSIIVLLVLIFGGNIFYKQWQEKQYLASLPPLDVTIMFMGNFESQDPKGKNEELNQEIIERYPAWNRVDTNIVYLPSTGNDASTLDMNYIQRAVAILAADHPNILVMDEATFDWIGQQDGLLNLEPVVTSAGLASDNVHLKRIKDKETGQEWITGLDITDTKFVSDLSINHAGTMIVGVLGKDITNKATGFVEFLSKEMAK